MTGQTKREAARARHPSAQARRSPNHDRMAQRLAQRLAAEGHPWPAVAAALLAERGRAGLDRITYAARIGIAPRLLAELEDGIRAEHV